MEKVNSVLDQKALENIFKKLFTQAKLSYDEFNSADGKIGDGDLGVTILNGLEEINTNISNFKEDLGHNFMFCSQAFVKKSGSSFGTLIAFSFMNISKNLKGKINCNHEDIINIFEIALKTIQERGKTKLGDKTIADSLDVIIKKLKNNNSNYPDLFKLATKKALDDFKGKKILVGRARMFEDKTKDLDDPGMFALNKLANIF
jgi:dihydroxyacetone kinase-like protein|tara:strand:- start:1673 stop:2281 length:609 start_codon:yes stop_codon:yes gene_type:complete